MESRSRQEMTVTAGESKSVEEKEVNDAVFGKPRFQLMRVKSRTHQRNSKKMDCELGVKSMTLVVAH